MEHYRALFEPDREQAGYVVTFPDFGYGVTQGEADDEAMEMARDLLMLTIGDREGKPLPVRSKRRGGKYRSVRLPFLQQAKVELRYCVRERSTEGYSQDPRGSAVLIEAPLAVRSDRSRIRGTRQTLSA